MYWWLIKVPDVCVFVHASVCDDLVDIVLCNADLSVELRWNLTAFVAEEYVLAYSRYR